MAPVSEVSATIIRKPVDAFSTWMPWRRTSSGSRGSTLRSRFCTFICAASMSVPARKVTVIDAEPFERLVEVM